MCNAEIKEAFKRTTPPEPTILEPTNRRLQNLAEEKIPIYRGSSASMADLQKDKK